MTLPPNMTIQQANEMLRRGRKIGKLRPAPVLPENSLSWDEDPNKAENLKKESMRREAEEESRGIREKAVKDNMDQYKLIQSERRGYSDSKTEKLVHPMSITSEYYSKPDFVYPKLPAVAHADEILNMVNKYDVGIISGATGSGKSLMVPQLILDDCVRNNKPCRIVVTQPRRIAAISLARYVAKLRDWKLGGLVGYKVSMEKMTSPETVITYATTGTLVSNLASEKNLDEFSHIIIDEVHERDQNIDFALLLAKFFQRSVSPKTKIIMMSATLDSKVFGEYFQIFNNGVLINAPKVEIFEKPYPINVIYEDNIDLNLKNRCDPNDIPTIEEQLSERKMENVIEIIEFIEQSEQVGRFNHPYATSHNGSILIFLPGLLEIQTMYSHLSKKKNADLYELIQLHSAITLDDQNRAFEQFAGKRKIIIATNIAESSITIPDINYVIDFCLTKQMTLNKSTNYCSLELQWASKASCDQRKGRAGRVSAGRVFRMVSENFYKDQLEDYQLPEIQRCPLEQIILKVKLLDMGEPRKMLALAISPPEDEDIVSSINRLKEIGGLVHEKSQYDGKITFLGEIVSGLPIDVALGKLVVMGFTFGLLEECVTIASCLSLKSFFSFRISEKMTTYKSKLFWSQNQKSDLFANLNAFNCWMQMFNGIKTRKSADWCRANGFIEKRLIDVKNFRTEILKSLDKKGIKPMANRPEILDDPLAKIELLKFIIGGSFYPNYYQLTSVDPEDAHKMAYGLSHFSSIVLRGFPIGHQKHYRRWVQDYASRFGIVKNIKFDYSKCIISYSHAYNLESKVPDAIKFALKDKAISKSLQAFSSQSHLSSDSIAEQRLLSGEIHSKSLPGHVMLPPPNVTQIGIIITEIESPCNYWARYADPQFVDALQKVHSRINKFQNKDFVSFSKIPLVKSLVLAPENAGMNSNYYRAIVISSAVSNKVDVFFVDFGWRKSFDFHLLKVPTNDIFDLHYQVFQVKIVDFEPLKSAIITKTALNESCEKVKNFIQGCKTFANIVSYTDSIINVSIDAINQSRSKFDLGEELLREGTLVQRAKDTYLESTARFTKRSTTESSEVNQNQQELGKPDYSIKINGPNSPIESKFTSLHSCGFYSNLVRVSPMSVNCIVLDEACGTNEPLPVMISVQVKSTGSGISVDDTTIITSHKNLIPYLILVFAPLFKCFYDQSGHNVEGILSGVGYDLPTDLNIYLFNKISKNEMANCEGIRYFINMILNPSENTIGSRFLVADPMSIREMQKKVIDLTLSLLKYDSSSVDSDERPRFNLSNYKWN